ncbi:MAG: SRPBCC family protein [Catenulispora sp.]|nr:SRPBCC family protein [Catenulispora sp.]
MFTTRPVDLDFLESAPLRLSFAGTLLAPPQSVFDAVARDVAALPRWYGAVTAAGYGGPEPHGVGAKRRVKLVGGVAFHEEVIAWDAPYRYAYRIERTNVPGIRAMAERWAVLETSKGTRLVWTIALDATAATAALARSMAPGMGLATRRALARLDRRLAG